MKTLLFILLICVIHWSNVCAKSVHKEFGHKLGIPLVFHDNSEPVTKTNIAPAKRQGDGNDTDDVDDDDVSDDDDNEDDDDTKDDEDTEDDVDDDDDVDDGYEEKSNEEKGLGYDNIKGMEPDDTSNKTAVEKDRENNSTDDVDLNADFPPNADQVYKLPKEVNLTPEQIDRKMMEKRKGYLSFTIKQRFKQEYKFKESPAFKILSGNVIHDVEKALKSTGVVKDILFREAKDEIPYKSKVEVFIKVKKVSEKRLKDIVDQGLINGMVTIPGSFHANYMKKSKISRN